MTLVLFAGCAKRYIAGTQIEDTEENHAIIEVMKQYRSAMEGRDADAIVALASPSFHDAGGTSDPDDDIAFRNLESALKQRFARIDNLNLVLDIRSINIGDDGKAEAVYYYTLRYDLPNLANARQSASDLKKMEFERVDDQWRIVSGI